VQLRLRDLTAARASLEEALTLRRKTLPAGDPVIAQSLTGLAGVQRELGDSAAARRNLEDALAIRRRALPPDHPDVADTLNGLGVAQHDLGDDAAARVNMEEAVAILRRSVRPQDPRLADALDSLGMVQCELRDYAAARRNLEAALAIRRQALPPDHPDIAQSLNNLGMVQRRLRELTAARTSFEEALALRRKSPARDDAELATYLCNLAVVRQELGEYREARSNYEEALAIRRRALPEGHPDIAATLVNLATMQFSLREYDAALGGMEEALAIRRRGRSPENPDLVMALTNLGVMRTARGEYAAAREHLGEALALARKTLPADHPQVGNLLKVLGVTDWLSGADVPGAVSRLAESTDILSAEQLRLAVAQAEEEQRAATVATYGALIALTGAALAAGADPVPVYDRVVRVKGSVTAQQRLARRLREAADPDARRSLDRLAQVSQQLVALSVAERPGQPAGGGADTAARIRSLAAERAELERQLAGGSAVYRAWQAQSRVGAAEVRAALPPGTALIDVVDYLQAEAPALSGAGKSDRRRLVAFVVRPERVAMVPLGRSEELAELIGRWRESYGAGRAPRGGPDPGAALRRRVWEPLAAHLAGVQVVLVSPDGPLHGLPWAALPGARPGTYLVHEYAFAVVPVPQLLPELLRGPAGRPAEPAALAVGDVDFGTPAGGATAAPGNNAFPPLPGTRAEAAAGLELFRAAFPGRPAELLSGPGATRAAFVRRAPDCSHLLVATHGFFLPEPEGGDAAGPGPLEALLFRRDVLTVNPALRSGLAFAGANRAAPGQGDAFLTALEVTELDLGRVDLAVLSACETGLGRVDRGQGVLGLQRAFQLGGARTVVTSLWKVPDAATQALMAEFYRNLWEQKLPRLEALRQAQLAMIRSFDPRAGRLDRGVGGQRPAERPGPKEGGLPPVYWAAFALSGDWR
jgi:CHAT domain-containing protein/tetratricopeptide (TPR) repeat protein